MLVNTDVAKMMNSRHVREYPIFCSARLVAKGFKQKEGLDYFDTYAPVARIAIIRTLIALASIYNFEFHQMDVTAFLNGELEEEICYA